MQDNSWLPRMLEALPGALPQYLQQQRWFAGKSDSLRTVTPWDAIPLDFGERAAYLFLVRAEYSSGAVQKYALPLVAAQRSAAVPESGARLVLPVEAAPGGGIFYDALHSAPFMAGLLNCIAEGASFHGRAGEVVGMPRPALSKLRSGTPEPSLLKAEQSNTSVRYDEQLILKFFRRLEEGQNLDLEVGVFLTERAGFRHSPPVAGAIEYRHSGAEPVTLALLQGYVRNQGDAWKYTLGELRGYLQSVREQPQLAPRNAPGAAALIDAALPASARERAGPYLEEAALLGRRTAELHLALASDTTDPEFRPEAFTPDAQRQMIDSMAVLAQRAFRLLKRQAGSLRGAAREDAQRVLALERTIFKRFDDVKQLNLESARTRVHGDYHLGQVLYTGDDFIIIDFEGEPEWPLAERRRKRSPLRDVAGMLRSFHYASLTAAAEVESTAEIPEYIDAAARAWRDWVSIAFLKAYLSKASAILPRQRHELTTLLDLHVLEKSVYELVYELNNRPEWVSIPLHGILDLF